ncbi:hypothetical protein NS44R_14640 [Mammaliicoccus sciuri]|nr:hypothetical protein NS44R_14640 [Mammaliicoccus sciuri]
MLRSGPLLHLDGLRRELRKCLGHDGAVQPPRIAAADEEWRLGGIALMIERVAALRVLACGRGLEQRRHRGTQQLGEMGAGLQSADLAAHQLAPALAYAFADQPLQNPFDVEAGRVGRRGHIGAGLTDRETVVDRETQPDVVHGIVGLLQAAMPVLSCIGLGVDQPRLDFPQPVVAEIAETFDGAAVHQAAGLAVGVGIRCGHRNSLDWI